MTYKQSKISLLVKVSVEVGPYLVLLITIDALSVMRKTTVSILWS